jgi:hypothetical protein
MRAPYICVQPKELMGTELKNYKPTIESCTPWNPFVNPVTVLITVDNECMILEILMIRNRNITLSSASLNPKKVDVVFNNHFLQNSWKVVVIISNAFTKSEWCQWEVDIIQERRRRQGRDAVLIIMLKTITSRHMTSPLTQYDQAMESLSHAKYILEEKTVIKRLFMEVVKNQAGDKLAGKFVG